MRVTNAMTSNQVLLNLTKNMNALNVLQYQAMTGNKIQYASDNPIVASRALKFRTNIAETEQYLSNVDQGKSWLNTSANSVKNVLEAMVNSGETSLRSLLVSGANGTNTVNDTKIYANQIRETLNEVLSELNSSYAGRYIFSGFKTDEKAVFDADSPGEEYMINQNFTLENIETDHRVYLKVDQLLDTDDEFQLQTTPAGLNIDRTAMPQELSVKRIKLPYDVGITDLAGFNGVNIVTKNSSTDADAYIPAAGEINFIEDTGELIFPDDVYNDIVADSTANKQIAKDLDERIANMQQSAQKNVTAAGAATALTDAQDLLDELNSITNGSILDKDSYDRLTKAKDAATAARDAAQDLVNAYTNLNSNPNSAIAEKQKNEALFLAREKATAAGKASSELTKELPNIQLEYKKSGFKKGDINPKVYFDCNEQLENGATKYYSMREQAMNFEFGANNKIQVNNLAKDLLTTELLNDLKDAINFAESCAPSNRDDLIAEYMGTHGFDEEKATEMADKQLQEEEKFYKDMIETRYTKLIGKLDTHSAQISKENTSLGTKINRMELIANRLADDKVNFEDLKSSNENVDIAETYIRYKSMESVYQSSLQMGASVMQMSLINFI